MYSNIKHNYSANGSSPNALMKGMPLTSGSPRSDIASGPSQGNHHFQVPIQPENVDLLMTAATALTSLTRPQGHMPGQGNREVLSALHGIPAAPMSQPPVHNQLKRKGQRQKATRFPVKLMQVLSSGRYDHIISWTPDGMSFVVRKPSLLVSDVLPLYFKEVKYTSFTRKLHRWGFVKILRGKELSAYYHRSFQRGDFERCSQMHCSKISHPMPKDGSIILESKASATKTDSPSVASATVTSQPPTITHLADRVDLSQNIETASETTPLDLRLREMQLIELQRLQRESLSMPPLHNSQLFNISNHIIQAGPRQQFIMQRSQVPLAFANQLGATLVNTVPPIQEFELARARHSHSSEHERIIANAWNVLSRERNKRTSYAQDGQGQGRILRNINIHYPPSA